MQQDAAARRCRCLCAHAMRALRICLQAHASARLFTAADVGYLQRACRARRRDAARGVYDEPHARAREIDAYVLSMIRCHRLRLPPVDHRRPSRPQRPASNMFRPPASFADVASPRCLIACRRRYACSFMISPMLLARHVACRASQSAMSRSSSRFTQRRDIPPIAIRVARYAAPC